MGLWREVGLFRGLGRKDERTIAIAAVGLTGFESRPIGSLSGGQMQRACCSSPSTRFKTGPLDEPFTAIDARNG